MQAGSLHFARFGATGNHCAEQMARISQLAGIIVNAGRSFWDVDWNGGRGGTLGMSVKPVNNCMCKECAFTFTDVKAQLWSAERGTINSGEGSSSSPLCSANSGR